MKPAADGYATRKQFALAGEIRRRYRNGERMPALTREYGLSALELARIIRARSQEGAAKILVGTVRTLANESPTVDTSSSTLQSYSH